MFNNKVPRFLMFSFKQTAYTVQASFTNNKWVLKLSSLFFLVQRESIIEFLIQYNESEQRKGRICPALMRICGNDWENWKEGIKWVIMKFFFYLQNFECRVHLMGEVVAKEIYSMPHELIEFAVGLMRAKALERSLLWWWSRQYTQSRLVASVKAHRCHEVQSPLASSPACRLLGKRDQNENKTCREAVALKFTRRLIITIKHCIKIGRACCQNHLVGIYDFSPHRQFNIAQLCIYSHSVDSREWSDTMARVLMMRLR